MRWLSVFVSGVLLSCGILHSVFAVEYVRQSEKRTGPAIVIPDAEANTLKVDCGPDHTAKLEVRKKGDVTFEITAKCGPLYRPCRYECYDFGGPIRIIHETIMRCRIWSIANDPWRNIISFLPQSDLEHKLQELKDSKLCTTAEDATIHFVGTPAGF
jgi:hypothetical protein